MPIYNKITLNGTTLIDLSTDTVAVADDITSGKVGHLNTGASATGTAQILDTSDATATSSDILSPKTAYVNGSKITGSITSKTAQTYTPTTTNQTISSGQYLSGTQTIVGDANLISANIASGVSIFGVAGSHSGGSANIQSLSVTANGTYTAPSGVDGYSPITVNVSGGGGASNLVTGTFTFSTSMASAQTVTLDYSGTGYPIACIIVLDDGVLNSTYTTTLARYAIAQYFMTKTYSNQTPTYSTSGDANLGAVASVYKASNTASATLTRSHNTSVNTFSSNNATDTVIACVRFTSKTNMSVYIGEPSGSSRQGFMNGQTYRYWVIYSS